MKQSFVILIILLSIGCSPDAEDEYESVQALKTDYAQSATVAHLRITSIVPMDTLRADDGSIGQIMYKIRGPVLNLYKGSVARGDTLEFNRAVENGLSPGDVSTERVVFLQAGNAGVPVEIENSSREASEKVLDRMKEIGGR